MKLTHEKLSHFEDTIQREWLVTNGIGGYASSTALGINTRKYHGLLVAALHPPGDRTVCLSKLDEEVSVGNNVYSFGANEFQGAVFPQGYQFLKEFSVSPFPHYVYTAGEVTVEKTIFMPNGKNAVVAVYEILNRSNSDVKIRTTPLITCRHFHSVVDRWRNSLNFSQQQNGNREAQLIFDFPKVSVAVRATDGEFFEKTNWIERLLYREDLIRGESGIDDCYQPGYFEVIVPGKDEGKLAIIAAAEDSGENTHILDEICVTMSDVERMLNRELYLRTMSLANFYGSNVAVPTSNWLSWILLTANTFTVKSEYDRKSIIAGYHWFESWGRDTFIALPGLMLVTAKFEDARNVFANFNAHCRNGLIPNYLEDQSGEASYNTVDATLWFINAVLQYLKYTGNFGFVQKQLWENLKDIIESHMKGTNFGIKMDHDGLLAHGSRLTWMDAEVDGRAVTPRAGKAVEIQALWYNSLRTVQLLAEKFGEKNLAESYATLANKIHENFNEKFWNNRGDCLFDVVGETDADASLRPNQIIAVALDFTMLSHDKNEKVLGLVERELSTPCGLRTLEQNDPRYKGVYFGDRRSRDQGYHNGAVWPWLMGPCTTAFLKTKGYTSQNCDFALQNFVFPLFARQVSQAALGTISEIFDGDSPHKPRGCISQAWSVAEPLRAYVEDVLRMRPKYEREILSSLSV
ncbi:MAG TPA: amylo-alpha-1,6-glucosidase [Candidatus Bathyarchaeia archaeon]|nr:amylo-alpha-1,6-glucosidase [Candidatus Bathyarchaeia archaeon]